MGPMLHESMTLNPNSDPWSVRALSPIPDLARILVVNLNSNLTLNLKPTPKYLWPVRLVMPPCRSCLPHRPRPSGGGPSTSRRPYSTSRCSSPRNCDAGPHSCSYTHLMPTATGVGNRVCISGRDVGTGVSVWAVEVVLR